MRNRERHGKGGSVGNIPERAAGLEANVVRGGVGMCLRTEYTGGVIVVGYPLSLRNEGGPDDCHSEGKGFERGTSHKVRSCRH